MASSAFLSCRLVSKFIWLPIILSVGKIKKIKIELPVLSHKEETVQQGDIVSDKHLFLP